MYEANVLGHDADDAGPAAAAGRLRRRPRRRLTSIAALEPYLGGAGYNAAKHAQRAMLRVLRLELLGQPVRVTEVAPGMVETEFSLVRFGGDEEAARQGLRGHASRSAPRTSPSASAGRSPSRPTSTSTRSSSARATRRPATERAPALGRLRARGSAR